MDYLSSLTLEGLSLHEAILQQVPFGILIAEAPSGRLLFCNQEAKVLLRHDLMQIEEEANDKGFGAIHPCGTSYLREEYPLARALRGQTVRQEELWYRRGDGSLICLLVNAVPIYDEQGQVFRAFLSFDEISERKQAELGHAKMQAKLQLATEIAKLGFFEWEPRTGKVFLSAEWKKQLGYDQDELENCFSAWRTRLHPMDRRATLALFRQFTLNPWPDFETEFRLRHRDGSYRWICCRADALYDDNGQLRKMVGTHLDVTERKEAEERIRGFVQHDSLTGLPNRQLLYEFAEHLLAGSERSGEQLAVLFIDVDHFKPVNDTYGHQVGDEVLKEVARRLKQAVRPEDVVARLGGDEFIVLATRIDNTREVVAVIEKLIERVKEPYQVGKVGLELSPSIGVGLYPGDGNDIGTLIQRADTAMRHAKTRGRGGYQFYTRSLERKVARTLDLEKKLRVSLDNGELELFYQPIVNAQTGKLSVAEALLRWPQADGSYIQPQQFIAVAERAGLIMPMGDWVLWQACSQYRLWQESGLPPVRIAINLSPMQFQGNHLEHGIARTLSSLGTPPDAVEIEVTESMIMEDVEDASRILSRLRGMGIRVALDDFGTGYSSLSQLGRLPLDKLKVDQSFVRNLFQDNVSVAITEAIIAMGHNLGLEVVAEGIETEQTLRFMHDRQCDEAQGFYLSRPVNAEEFAAWARGRQG